MVIPAAYHSAKSHSGIDEGDEVDSIISGTIKTAVDANIDLGLDGLDEDSIHGLKIISRGTAILLLFVYIAYLVFQVGVLRACGSEAFLTAIAP